MISPVSIPSAIRPIRVATGMRVPRMHGTPAMTRWSATIRWKVMKLRVAVPRDLMTSAAQAWARVVEQSGVELSQGQLARVATVDRGTVGAW